MNFSDEYFEAVNTVLPQSSPMGAYCVGVVSAIFHQETGASPTKMMVQAAAMCRTVAGAVELAKMFVTEEKATRRKKVKKGGSSVR